MMQFRHSALFFGTKVLSSQNPALVDMSYVDTLPAPNTPTLHCTWQSAFGYASAALLVGEVLELQQRHLEVIDWAQAELQNDNNINIPMKARAGRLLGRAHAALGQHSLSVAALEAAIQASRGGELLLSESLTLRERAHLGKAAAAKNAGSGSGQNWDAEMGRQHLDEMMGRMGAGKGGERRALLEKLLLPRD